VLYIVIVTNVFKNIIKCVCVCVCVCVYFLLARRNRLKCLYWTQRQLTSHKYISQILFFIQYYTFDSSVTYIFNILEHTRRRSFIITKSNLLQMLMVFSLRTLLKYCTYFDSNDYNIKIEYIFRTMGNRYFLFVI